MLQQLVTQRSLLLHLPCPGLVLNSCIVCRKAWVSRMRSPLGLCRPRAATKMHVGPHTAHPLQPSPDPRARPPPTRQPAVASSVVRSVVRHHPPCSPGRATPPTCRVRFSQATDPAASWTRSTRSCAASTTSALKTSASPGQRQRSTAGTRGGHPMSEQGGRRRTGS